MKINRTIKFAAFNKFTCDIVLELTMPYDPHKSIYGHYSRLWKRMKRVVCETENMPPQNISVKFQIIKSRCQRTLWEWPSGFKLDMPNDATDYDYKIVEAQLEVFKMAAKC